MTRCRLLTAISLLLFLTGSFCQSANAEELRFLSGTLLQSYERDKTAQADIAVIPLYEYIQVETGALTKPGLSVHAYGWGRTDLGDRDFFDQNEAGELLHGFVEYSNDRYSFNARLGRQSIFEGPANEIIDGLSIRGVLMEGLSMTFFSGLPVSLAEVNGTDGDMVLGTKIGYNSGEQYDVALSYKKIESDGARDDEIVGVDMFYALPKGIDLSAMSTRSLVTNDWREHFIEAHLMVEEVAVRPYLQRFQYQDLLNTRANSANPFRYLAGTDENLTTIGSDFIWPGKAGIDFGLKAKAYDFDKRGDTAEYLGGTVIWHKEKMSQIGLEAGVAEGDDIRDEYILTRLYAYWEDIPFGLPMSFLTGDLLYVNYGKEINGEDTSLFMSIGGGMSFLGDSIELKLSGDYASDPFYNEDYRSTLTLIYKYTAIKKDEE